MNKNIVPKIGGYFRVTKAYSDEPQDQDKVYKINMIINDTLFFSPNGYGYRIGKVELIPEEIYNSPLFRAMQEEIEDV